MVGESMSRVYGSREGDAVPDKQQCQDRGCGPHQCGLSSQSESAGVVQRPTEHYSDLPHLSIFLCNITGSGCVMNANNEDVGSLLSEPVEQCV